MELKYAIQVDIRELDLGTIDLFIASSGFEKRATYFFEKYCDANFQGRKLAFAFNDREVLVVEENLKHFRTLGFTIIKAFENTGSEILTELTKFISEKSQSKEINILVDYSCMTKVWYATIIRYIQNIENTDIEDLNVYFSYTRALYEVPGEVNPSFSTSLLPGYYALQPPHRKVSLLIGLGYEENRAMGLIEYLHLDYDNCYLFRTDRESGQSFYDDVEKSNSELLRRIPAENIFEYPVGDLTYLESILSTLAIDLASNAKRVLIAPMGPKPFSLISILLAAKHRTFNIYRITQTPINKPAERIPDEAANPIICKVKFQRE